MIQIVTKSRGNASIWHAIDDDNLVGRGPALCGESSPITGWSIGSPFAHERKKLRITCPKCLRLVETPAEGVGREQ